MLTDALTQQYLNKLEINNFNKADFNTLAGLQSQHTFIIPFETIDAYLQTPAPLTFEAIFQKIINGTRGGYCYEVNYLFYCLLKKLGYQTNLHHATMYNDDGKIIPNSSHLLITVELDRIYIVDVGWGNAFSRPLSLCNNTVLKNKNIYTVHEGQTPRYFFELQPAVIEDFLPRHHYHSHNKNSLFQKQLMISRHNPTQVTTLHNCLFTQAVFGKVVKEYKIFSPSQLQNTLSVQFNISVDNCSIEQLWSNLLNRQQCPEYQLRKAKISEVDAINKLIAKARATWGYSDAENQAFLKKFGVTKQYVQTEMLDVLVVDNKIIAVIGGTISNAFHGDYLFLDPNYHKQGLGHWLWNHFCSALRSHGATRFDFITNPYAKYFCLKMGATLLSDYGDPTLGMTCMRFVIEA